MLSFVSTILGKKVKGLHLECRQFCWKDYTLLNDKTLEDSGYDVLIDFTDSWDEQFGGDMYYTDGSGESQSIFSSPNTLTVVQRKKNVQKFFKYVNHYAGKHKRILLLGSLRL